MKPSIPAVIIGAELNGLGMARSLALGNVPTFIFGTAKCQAGMWTRHAKPILVEDFSGRAFIEQLLALGKATGQRPVLLLTDEFAVHSVSANRDILAPHFRFRLPQAGLVETLADKSGFQHFAQRHALPIPGAVVVDNATDISRLALLRYPAIVKPTDKRQTLSGAAKRTVRAADVAQASAAAIAILHNGGTAIVQEWIEGPETNIFFTLFYRGDGAQPVSIFTGRKLLCFPRDVGSTAACLAAPAERRQLEALTMHFADLAGFEGLGSMEYKWDLLRGEFLMVEPTVGRSDWQEEVATLYGQNIPLEAWRHETGLGPQPVGKQVYNAVWRSSHNQIIPPQLLPSDAVVTDGYFRLRDPAPAIIYYFFDRLPKRLQGTFSPERRTKPRMAKQ